MKLETRATDWSAEQGKSGPARILFQQPLACKMVRLEKHQVSANFCPILSAKSTYFNPFKWSD
jgi:hypothetical protein